MSGERAGQSTEDGRLAEWVQAVVQSWRAQGLRGRELASLFAGLLHELVVARTRGAVTEQIIDLGPEAAADGIAETGRLRQPRPRRSAGRRRRTGSPREPGGRAG
jgi:hypothetical protein